MAGEALDFGYEVGSLPAAVESLDDIRAQFFQNSSLFFQNPTEASLEQLADSAYVLTEKYDHIFSDIVDNPNMAALDKFRLITGIRRGQQRYRQGVYNELLDDEVFDLEDPTIDFGNALLDDYSPDELATLPADTEEWKLHEIAALEAGIEEDINICIGYLDTEERPLTEFEYPPQEAAPKSTGRKLDVKSFAAGGIVCSVGTLLLASAFVKRTRQ